jgi:CAAX protease family protein
MFSVSSVVRRHPIITFFVLSYALAWMLVPFGSFGAYGPLVAALIVIPITRGVAGLEELGLRVVRWRVGWYWYAVAIGVPLAVHLAVVVLNVATGAGVPSLTFASLTTFLMVFAIRLVNPTDGPLDENPGVPSGRASLPLRHSRFRMLPRACRVARARPACD